MDQKRYIDFYDMIDGGGAGQAGDKFQGGGLFSALANLVADPYGSQDPERMQKLQQMRGLLDTGMDMGGAGGSAPTPPQVINPTVDIADDARRMRTYEAAPVANPLADMPATDFMNAMGNRTPTDPQVPFGGYQQPSPGVDMLKRLREMGIDINSMPPEQLQSLMSMYVRGGPFNYKGGM